MVRLGLMQSSLDRNDLEKSFEWARQVGAEGLEITCATPADAAFLFSPAGHDRVKQLSSLHKVQAASLALGVLCQNEAFLGSEPVAKAAGEVVAKAIDCCVKTGMGTVLIPFFGKSSIEVEAHVNMLPDRLAESAELAEQAGVVLGIESLMNINQQLYVLDCLASYKSVKIYVDPANILPRKIDPPTNVRDLGKDRLCQIHLKDVRISEGHKPDFNVALGEGNVDMAALVNALRAIRYDGWVILETPPGDDPLEMARRNLQTARQLLERNA